jgi:3D-(3,5/4)-trihydroxycyclohexane-1,2-dione acylhydrolase (decyclizing)
MSHVRLTVGQATVRFLAVQMTERDGVTHRLVEGCFGIFGHGNVAGLGQALLEAELSEPTTLPYYQARNEQAMVHAAAGFARMRNRLSTLACTTSVGPGATNMVTGAALATVNRIPVLLLPSDVFANRSADPVLQQLEHFSGRDVSANDAFRPVSRFFDRVQRPEQLADSLLAAMRVLADPVDTGAVTICLPEDVQAEAFDWPLDLFEPRSWRVPRSIPDPASVSAAAALIRRATRPLIVAGGGVIYSEATEALRALAEDTGIPVAETQAGKGALRFDHPQAVGAIGATGTVAANALANSADVVVGIGTRWSDFTTASRSLFADPNVRFVNCNVAAFDASKNSAIAVVGDGRATIERIHAALSGWSVAEDYRAEVTRRAESWDRVVSQATSPSGPGRPSQAEVIGAVNEFSSPDAVVVGAAGSLPGDLHKLWRTRSVKGYHVEYGFSCMGYEIAGGLGVKMAAPDRDVYVMVGDGSYLMMAQELVTAVQESIHITVVLIDNHGFASIGSLSERVGSQRFGTEYRYRNPASGRLDGDVLPVDLAANAESLGAVVYSAESIEELRAALAESVAVRGPVVIHIETDATIAAPDSRAWWDVPVAEVSELESTSAARRAYEQDRSAQRLHL